jgi:hypothetical protein
MALTLAKMQQLVERRNRRPSRDPYVWLLDMEALGILPSSLGESFPNGDGWFWQTPFGDLIVDENGMSRINDEGEG